MEIPSENMRGAILMTASMTAYTVNDAFFKALSDELPLFQAIFVRGIAVVACLTVAGIILGQLTLRQSKRDWFFILARAVFELGAAFLFLLALINMPIANVTAILQALPLTVSLAAAVFLGATIGWRRLAAIFIGFIGVLLIIKPGSDGFNVYALYALAAVGFVTARDILVPKISKEVPTMVVAWATAVVVMLGGGAMSLTETWQPLSTLGQLQMAGAVIAILGGSIFSIVAMRHGDIAFVAPFRYSGLIAAVIVGFVFFSEFPDTLTIIGSLIVVGTGIFTLYRDNRIAKRTQIEADSAFN